MVKAKRGGAGTEYKEAPPEEKKDGTIVKAWQRMPTQLLHEWAQAQKRPKPCYNKAWAYDKSKCRMKVILPDPKDPAKNLEFEPNRDADVVFNAKEDAAMVALLQVCPTLPLERKLPDGYRETWLEAVGGAAASSGKAAKAKAKAKEKPAAVPEAPRDEQAAAAGEPPPADEAAASGRAAAERERREAQARREEAAARAAEEERLAKEAQHTICFEWQRTGKCKRNGCRFDHPPLQQPGSDAADAGASAGARAAAPRATPGGPLGAVSKHWSRADREREERESRDARAQERNKKRAMAEAKRIVNMQAPALLSRRMRQQLSEALGLGAELAEAGQVQASEALTDAEAGALRICAEDWGFTPEAASAALAAAQAEGEAAGADEAALAERLRVWLCLHLPEEDLPEAFAAGKGQFEVRRATAPAAGAAAAPGPSAAAEAGAAVFGWLAAQLRARAPEEADALFACAEVVLRPPLEPDAPLDMEEAAEALDSAKEILRMEDSVEEALLDQLSERWAAALAARAEVAAAAAAAAAPAPGDEGAAAPELPGGSAEREATPPGPKAGFAPEPRGAKRKGIWFGWRASTAAAARDLQAWHDTEKGQKMQRFRESLPAARVRGELARLLGGGQVVLVHGETGSGKTTQIGQFLLEGAADGSPPRVVVTQPRRFAAVSVATRVAEERGERVGEGSVGYVVRGESKMRSESCQLLFCTLGVLLRRLVADGLDAMFGPDTMTHLILDEVHERSMDMDFALTLLRHKLPARPELKVLLMSATMDVGALGGLFPAAPPVLQIPGRTFPVEELHLDDVEDLLGTVAATSWASPAPARRGGGPEEAGEGEDEAPDDWDAADELGEQVDGLGQGGRGGVGAAAARARQRPARGGGSASSGSTGLLRPPGPVDYDMVAALVVGLADGSLSEQARRRGWPVEGAILVFMPGAGEISKMISVLERSAGGGGRKLLNVLPLHGGLTSEQQRRCFEVGGRGAPRKVVVATNVAETSVTLPDVTVVIDSCREKRLTRDHDLSGLAPALLERVCARDSLKQRRGRAGRTQRGVCFRLIPKRLFDQLPANTAPEIEVLPLETLALQVRAAGFEPADFLASAPSPPPTAAVAEAEGLLRTLGAVLPEGAGRADGKEAAGGPAARLTALGRHLAVLPCDVRVGRLVVLGAFLGCAPAACSVAAWLSVRSPLVRPWQPEQERNREELQRRCLKGKGGSKSDHCFWVAVVDGYLAAGWKQRRSLCAELGLSYDRMSEVESVRSQLLGGLRSLGFGGKEAEANGGDWRIVRAALVAGLYPFVARVERPAARYADGIAGAIQKDAEARELRYFVLDESAGPPPDGARMPARARAFLHPSSLLFKETSYACPYVVFSERLVQQQAHNEQFPTRLSLSGCSEASVYALLLFGGHLAVDHQTATIAVDGWIRFSGGSTTVAAMLERLRREIDSLLLEKVEEPGRQIGESPVARCVVSLLRTDGLG